MATLDTGRPEIAAEKLACAATPMPSTVHRWRGPKPRRAAGAAFVPSSGCWTVVSEAMILLRAGDTIRYGAANVRLRRNATAPARWGVASRVTVPSGYSARNTHTPAAPPGNLAGRRYVCGGVVVSRG